MDDSRNRLITIPYYSLLHLPGCLRMLQGYFKVSFWACYNEYFADIISTICYHKKNFSLDPNLHAGLEIFFSAATHKYSECQVFCSVTIWRFSGASTCSHPWWRIGFIPIRYVFWSSGFVFGSGLIVGSTSLAKAEPVQVGVSEQSIWLKLRV